MAFQMTDYRWLRTQRFSGRCEAALWWRVRLLFPRKTSGQSTNIQEKETSLSYLTNEGSFFHSARHGLVEPSDCLNWLIFSDETQTVIKNLFYRIEKKEESKHMP